MSAKTVFISYRRDATGRLFARLLAEELTRQGYDVFLDVDSIDPGKWAEQILTQAPVRAHFLLLLTPGSLDRCANEDDWVRQEFEIAVQSKRNIVPVREESVDLVKLRNDCPGSMRGVFDFQIATIQHGTFRRDVEDLVKRYIPPHKAPQAHPVAERPIRADISRIIKYAPADLIGREDELKLLCDAWGQAVRTEKRRPHVLTFVALGGEGKTSLVAKWAAELAHQEWPGCAAAFAWSFYSQGTREQTQASSDTFLAEALRFFGDEETAGSAKSAFDKGKRLAQLVGERRALLILDGLEPLQYAPGPPMEGKLKDDGVASLLKSLAGLNQGLCVVTTRYSIPDLKAFWQTTAPEVRLASLSREAGVHLLKTLDVKGTEKEFETLVDDVKGHALTLNLLGTYLRDAHGGDIRRRDLVKLSEADAEEQGGHAFRVMEAYERAFEGEGDKGNRALAILRLLGLFDRPMTSECLAALLQAPAIPNLTEMLMGLTDAPFNIALSRLQSAKLITVNRDASGALVSLDAHPLLREYFAKQLRENNSDAWREAHRRLYQHLCETTKEGDQPTLEELQPLYQAVAHGCQAGLHQEVCDDVYFGRTLRGNEHYSLHKLGAFGSDLGAVACFFDSAWSRVSTKLQEADKAWLLGAAATRLRALGRLTEALEPMRVGLEMRVEQEDWKNAAIATSNLSELELTLGEKAGAVKDAEQCVSYADRSGSAFWKRGMRTTHADALHQAGCRAEAEKRFREAEQIQMENQTENLLLYGIAGFRYCDLLLATAENAAWQIIFQRKTRNSNLEAAAASCRGVAQRAARTLESAEMGGQGRPLPIALDHLTLGRSALYAAILEGSDFRHPTSDLSHIDTATAGLRRASAQEFIVRGLHTRAWLRFLTGAHTGAESAQTDLDEAWEIAERGPMRFIHGGHSSLSRAIVSCGEAISVGQVCRRP